MLTVSQIIEASWRSVMSTHGDRYQVTEPVAVPNAAGYYCTMYDTLTNNHVPMVWTFKEDVDGTERDRVSLVSGMLENAMNCLDMLNGDEVENVVDTEREN